MNLREKYEEYFKVVEEANNKTPFYRTLLKDQALKEFSEKKASFAFVVADSISTKGVKTMASSKMLENYIPSFDATVVEKLKTAGGVLLGKTITLEFGVGEAETTFGTNIAVEKGENIIGLTIDSKGFMHLGAYEYGLYGYTPTFGLVSRYGLLTVASSIDRIGILTKEFDTVRQAASIIIDKDEKDSLSLESEEDFQNLEDIDLKSIKVSKLDKLGRFNKEAKFLEDLGVKLEDKEIEGFEYCIPVYEILSSGEFATNMEKYDSISFGYRTEDFKDLNDLYKNSRSQGLGRGVQEKILFGNFCLSKENYKDYYVQAMKGRTMIKENIYKLLDENEFIVAPISLYYTSGINLSGLPSISLPYGPEGILITSKAFNDKRLLSFAKELSKELEGDR